MKVFVFCFGEIYHIAASAIEAILIFVVDFESQGRLHYPSVEV